MQPKTDLFTQISPSKSFTADTCLFTSHEWKARFGLVGINPQLPVVNRHYRIRFFSTLEQELSDYERAPNEYENLEEHLSLARKENADWAVFRKLRTPIEGSTLYSHAPYLDLTQPIQIKKEVASHLGRTERKLTREIGSPELVLANTIEGAQEWFKQWSAFHQASGHFDPIRFETFNRWTTSTTPPDWMKLYSLKAGSHTLACGLFYEYKSKFYYYSPTQNPEDSLKKYGGGKLLTHYLIEQSKSEGLEEFDFLQGAHAYKLHWNPKMRPLYQKFIPLTLKGHIASIGFSAKKLFKGMAT